jgi:hypothetical protein
VDFEEKKYPAGGSSFKEVAGGSRREGQTGRRPGKGEAEPGRPEALEVHRFILRKRERAVRARGAPRKGDAFWVGHPEGEPERPESPGEQCLRPGLKLRGAKRRTASLGGSSRWSAGIRPERFGF